MSSDPLSPTDELNRLLNRLFEMSRPIADGFHEPGLDMRISDPDRFFEIIRELQRLSYPAIEQSLLMLLDEFAQLEQRSYDELYLWSIVELSRRQGDHVEMLWPLVLTLDLRYRAEPWVRPDEFTLLDRPYRLTELVMYFYAPATQEPEPDEFGEVEPLPVPLLESPRDRLLANRLHRIRDQLNDEQRNLMLDTLRELAHNGEHPAFGDALGILLRPRRPEPA